MKVQWEVEQKEVLQFACADWSTPRRGRETLSIRSSDDIYVHYLHVGATSHTEKLKSPFVNAGVIFHCHNSLKCGRASYNAERGGGGWLVGWCFDGIFLSLWEKHTKKGKKWHSCLQRLCYHMREISQEPFWIIILKLLLILVSWLWTEEKCDVFSPWL